MTEIMIHFRSRREIEGFKGFRQLEKIGFHNVTKGLAKLTCYPPDQFIFLQSENVDELVPSFATAFSNVDPHILASADEDGVMRYFDTRKKLSNGFISGFEAHDNAIFDIAWAHDEPWIVTASGDQTAVLWDAPTGKKRAVFKQHTGSLKSVSFGFQSNSILATGARDGSILIWDTRCSEKTKGNPVPVATIIKAHEDKELSRVKPRRRRGMPKSIVDINPLQSVTTVLFQSSEMLLSSGSADGVVKMWDIRTLPKKQKKTPVPYHSYHYSGNSQGKHGFSSLAMDFSHSRFYANCTDGTVYAYDCVGLPNCQPVATYSGHVNSTFYVKSVLSPDDQYLLSGSSDFNAYIWKVNEPDCPPIILHGHSGEVTAVAWSPVDRMKVVTCADDCTMRIWRMRIEGEKEEEKAIGEAKWEEPSQIHCSVKARISCTPAPVSESASPKTLPSSTPQRVSSVTPRRAPVTPQRGPSVTPLRGPSSSTGSPSTPTPSISKTCSSPNQQTRGRAHFNLKAWATPSDKMKKSSLNAGLGNPEQRNKTEWTREVAENSTDTKTVRCESQQVATDVATSLWDKNVSPKKSSCGSSKVEVGDNDTLSSSGIVLIGVEPVNIRSYGSSKADADHRDTISCSRFGHIAAELVNNCKSVANCSRRDVDITRREGEIFKIGCVTTDQNKNRYISNEEKKCRIQVGMEIFHKRDSSEGAGIDKECVVLDLDARVMEGTRASNDVCFARSKVHTPSGMEIITRTSLPTAIGNKTDSSSSVEGSKVNMDGHDDGNQFPLRNVQAVSLWVEPGSMSETCNTSPPGCRSSNSSPGSSKQTRGRPRRVSNLRDWIKCSPSGKGDVKKKRNIRTSPDRVCSNTSLMEGIEVELTKDVTEPAIVEVNDKENKTPLGLENLETRIPLVDGSDVTEHLVDGGSGGHDGKQLSNEDNSPKKKTKKRGRGDQIFDYFQPLKRMKKDPTPPDS